MDKTKFIGFIIVVVSPIAVIAQQVSPIPEFEKQIRNGTSIRMRSAELERIKREANKVYKDESVNERKIRFTAIREDFESIQKLQDSIIKAYTRSKKINYSKIAKSARSMSKNARRLDVNLFGKISEGLLEEKKLQKSIEFDQKIVPDLIVKLDNAIGKFVVSPIFQDLQTIDSEASKIAQTDLEKVINLSQKLFRSAEIDQ